MDFKITYPTVEKHAFARRKMLAILRWPFIATAIASVIVNLCVG